MTDSPEVPIEFKGRHDQITERMQEHATRKLRRLARYGDALTRIEVVAEHAHESPEIELIAHQTRGAPLVAKDRGESFSSTIDLLVDKMEAQLRKAKERRKDHKHPEVREERERATDRVSPLPADEETYEDVVRKTLDD
ncbi:MAG TPA: ribosome-associated translation inhibitor RaiA [bacterium]|nr:ribosome-associated translation inhibitor RaiA [bacterium]